jgi:hypothetical protein
MLGATIVPLLCGVFEGGLLAAAGGLAVSAIGMNIVSVQQKKARKLEEIIKDLEDTKILVREIRDAIVSSADNLLLASRLADRGASRAPQ